MGELKNPIEIILPRYDFYIVVDKTDILNLFPNSLLATILEQDSTATQIELTQSFLTPTILGTLSDIIFFISYPPSME